jgi:secreted trypsin-like serine protease
MLLILCIDYNAFVIVSAIRPEEVDPTNIWNASKEYVSETSYINLRKNRSRHVSEKILNGTLARPGQYPYLVLFPNCFCHGTLIGPDWMLTAAYCTRCMNVGDDILIQGDKVSAYTGYQHYVQEIFIHPR